MHFMYLLLLPYLKRGVRRSSHFWHLTLSHWSSYYGKSCYHTLKTYRISSTIYWLFLGEYQLCKPIGLWTIFIIDCNALNLKAYVDNLHCYLKICGLSWRHLVHRPEKVIFIAMTEGVKFWWYILVKYCFDLKDDRQGLSTGLIHRYLSLIP